MKSKRRDYLFRAFAAVSHFVVIGKFALEKIEILVKTENGVALPEYKTAGAAGADICAHLEAPLVMKPLSRAVVPTGLFFAIPQGYEIQVRPRSGLAAKNGVTVLNTPGTIDSDYRGELKVILVNLGDADFTVNDGDRIAQIVAAPVTQAAFSRTENLSETERGAGGFGSTGV